MRKLKCFVACAFGKSDVDEVYEKCIQKSAKKSEIIFYRVDKVTHNEKIDKKILDLISDCDFCIADLTYARPSVYYEAGRVHGLNKPVIFTARKDHFKDIKEDIYGNFKIHFDLITHNIIPWYTPTTKFKNDLSDRIKLIIKPIQKKITTDKTEEESKKEFNTLSLVEKKYKILKKSMEVFLRKNFTVIYERKDDYILMDKKEKSIILGFVQNQIDKKLLKFLNPDNIPNFYITVLKGFSLDTYTSIKIYLFSIKSVSELNISNVFPLFNKDPNNKEYYFNKKKSDKSIKINMVDNIKSIYSLEKSLEKTN
jgi:hypothetical protein